MWKPRRLRLPFRRFSELERDNAAELLHHLEASREAMVNAGVPPDTARDEAIRRLGDIPGLRRRLTLGDWIDQQRSRLRTATTHLGHDIGFSLRMGRRRAGTSLLLILTLAMGVGVATTFASIVDTLLLRPLPILEPEAVVRLHRVPIGSGEPTGVAPATIADWRSRARSFAALAGAEPYSLAYDPGSGPRSIGTWRVTPGFFEVLRVVPLAGRLLGEGDFAPTADRAVVVSHRFWRSQLGGDPTVVGSTIPLDDDRVPHRVVGVLPASFPYSAGRDLYVPLQPEPRHLSNRRSNYFEAYGRLRDGVSVQGAETELREIAAATALENPQSDAGWSAAVVALQAGLTGSVRPTLLLLLLASGLILAIATMNAASLQLAEVARREHELAVRAALGAGRRRIIRQLITEAGVLATIATGIGVAVAACGVAAFRQVAPAGLPRLNELQVDLRVLVLGAGIACLAASIVAIPAALRALPTNLAPMLKPGGTTGRGAPTSNRLRAALVTMQVALAVVLLAGAGLLVRSWWVLSATDQGYRAEGLAGIELHVWSRYPSAEDQRRFADLLRRELETAERIHAAIGTLLPLTPPIGDTDAEVRLPGDPAPLPALGVIAGPGYLEALSIPVRFGTSFAPEVSEDGEPIVILSESLARRLFPGGTALGQSVVVSFGGPPTSRRVVGVVGDVRFTGLEEEAPAAVYLPFAQVPTGSLFAVARSPAGVEEAQRAMIRGIGSTAPGLVMEDVVRLADQAHLAGRPRRLALMLLNAFGAVAAILTGIGLYALMTHNVRARTRELGVRLALGAAPALLRRMVLRQAAAMAAVGAVLGIGAFLVLGGTMRRLLYGVPTVDLPTLGGVGGIVAGLALLAAWGPARMATRVDPATALRTE